MGLRVKRYGPLSTMMVVGRLVGTFEPALVIVTMDQATSASAKANTIAPNQPAGRSTGRPINPLGQRLSFIAPYQSAGEVHGNLCGNAQGSRVMKIDGRCHCGHVTFEAEADPEMTTICNCTDCQTMSGAPLRAVITTRPGTFVL